MENITVRPSFLETADRLECEPKRRHQDRGQCRVCRFTARIRV